MSRTIELPEALYVALEREADAQGTTPVGWIARHLGEAMAPTESVGTEAQADGGSLADLFTGRLGRVAGGGASVASDNVGDRFADHLDGKRSAGCL